MSCQFTRKACKGIFNHFQSITDDFAFAYLSIWLSCSDRLTMYLISYIYKRKECCGCFEFQRQSKFYLMQSPKEISKIFSKYHQNIWQMIFAFVYPTILFSFSHRSIIYFVSYFSEGMFVVVVSDFKRQNCFYGMQSPKEISEIFSKYGG